MFDVTQHLVMNRRIEIDGDTATGRSELFNPNRLTIEGQPWIFTVGGVYHDRYARTADGWRIVERVEECTWWTNPPPGLGPQPPGVAGAP
jgi:hypothetical protein